MLSPRPGEPRVPRCRLLGGRATGHHVPGTLGPAWARVLYGHHVPGAVPRRCVHDVSPLVEPPRAHWREGCTRPRPGRPAHRDRGLCHRLAARRWLSLGPPREPAGDAGWGAPREGVLLRGD